MSHFAHINKDNTVDQVIVAEQSFIDSLDDSNSWIQTSYNTHGGKHSFGGIPLRKNYAGIGYIYDEFKDAFIPPKPFQSWYLDEDTCLWNPPVLMPEDGKIYRWNELSLNWEEIPNAV